MNRTIWVMMCVVCLVSFLAGFGLEYYLSRNEVSAKFRSGLEWGIKSGMLQLNMDRVNELGKMREERE